MTDINFTATYSPEDNKLRLCTEGERVCDEVYSRLRKLGFKWAPIQKIFVAPKWTPGREDLCVELAGEIVCEESTMLERAEAKAARLDALAIKRADQANSFSDAARRLADRLSSGQPILIGHHSERKARKDLERSEAQQEKAVEAASSVSYWQYRAVGVKQHANRKNYSDVRARRIKTLLAELRDLQRDINHAYRCIQIWMKVDSEQDEQRKKKLTEFHANVHLDTGPTAPYGTWGDLQVGKKKHQEVIDNCLKLAEAQINSVGKSRWIQHILNRLAYERYEQGETSRFEGELTATIIKAFVRENGAHKPECNLVEGHWTLTSEVPLPLHIAEGETLTLSDDGWRDLMVSIGYVVPDAKPAKAQILNFKAKAIKTKRYGSVKELRQIELTKEKYAEVRSESRGVMMSECGQFRFKVCLDPFHTGPYYQAGWVSVYLVNSKVHPTPDSESIIPTDKDAA